MLNRFTVIEGMKSEVRVRDTWKGITYKDLSMEAVVRKIQASDESVRFDQMCTVSGLGREVTFQIMYPQLALDKTLSMFVKEMPEWTEDILIGRYIDEEHYKLSVIGDESGTLYRNGYGLFINHSGNIREIEYENRTVKISTAHGNNIYWIPTKGGSK